MTNKLLLVFICFLAVEALDVLGMSKNTVVISSKKKGPELSDEDAADLLTKIKENPSLAAYIAADPVGRIGRSEMIKEKFGSDIMRDLDLYIKEMPKKKKERITITGGSRRCVAIDDLD